MQETLCVGMIGVGGQCHTLACVELVYRPHLSPPLVLRMMVLAADKDVCWDLGACSWLGTGFLGSEGIQPRILYGNLFI